MENVKGERWCNSLQKRSILVCRFLGTLAAGAEAEDRQVVRFRAEPVVAQQTLAQRGQQRIIHLDGATATRTDEVMVWGVALQFKRGCAVAQVSLRHQPSRDQRIERAI